MFRYVVFVKSFFLYRILLKNVFQIKCTINMCKEQLTSIKWLTMKCYRKLIYLIIYMHNMNLLQLIVQT